MPVLVFSANNPSKRPDPFDFSRLGRSLLLVVRILVCTSVGGRLSFAFPDHVAKFVDAFPLFRLNLLTLYMFD